MAYQVVPKGDKFFVVNANGFVVSTPYRGGGKAICDTQEEAEALIVRLEEFDKKFEAALPNLLASIKEAES